MPDARKLKAEELEKEPELTRSYAGWFAVLGGLFFASFVWAVWDETIHRRPWKRYQAEFQALEEHLLGKALVEVRDQPYDPAQKQHLREIQIAYQQAVEAYEHHPKVQQLRKTLPGVEEELYRAQRTFQQARGQLQEAEYWKEKTGARWALEKVASLTPQVEKLRATYDGLIEKKAQLQAGLEELAEKKRRLQEQLNARKQPELDLVRRLDGSRVRRHEIKQIHIPQLDLVDRCQSCHLAVRDPMFSNAVQPFATHPKIFSLWKEDPSGNFSWKAILNVHPPERFGCTSCHRGQGYATTSPEEAHGDVEYWPTPMLRGQFVQASCLKCHQDLDRLPGAELLAHGRQLFDRHACHNCHLVKGYEDTRKAGPDLRLIGTKVNRDWLAKWLKDPRDYLPQTKMPNFLLSDEEVEHITDFLLTLRGDGSTDEDPTWPAWASKPFEDLTDEEFDAFDELVTAGEVVWGTARCSICHPRGGLGGATGLCPDLGRIVTKVNRGWLYRWMQHPRRT